MIPPHLQNLPDQQDEMHHLLAHLSALPPHAPTRYETTDGFEDPKCTNGDRASMAAGALATFQKSCGMTDDVETAAADLICDLLHLVHANNRDPVDVLQAAIRHFLCEAGEVTVCHS